MSEPPGESVSRRVLVMGATGYVGSRLVPALQEHGHEVRVLARDPVRVRRQPWAADVEVAVGDALEPATLPGAMEGIDVVYYLIHSLTGEADYRERDKQAARHTAQAARGQSVGRIIYLGGLGDPDSDLSEHLRSRQETGEALREAGVAVTEFRAAIVVGAGSVSFEMIRHLAERVPVMICPSWVYTRVQPIAIDDVVRYLVAAPVTPASADRILEIGGAEVLTYGAMMTRYARIRGLRRWLIPVPVLTPKLSAYWVHWVTPISARYAHPLIEGLRNEVIVRDDAARRVFPEIAPIDYDTAVRRALARIESADEA